MFYIVLKYILELKYLHMFIFFLMFFFIYVFHSVMSSVYRMKWNRDSKKHMIG